MYHVSDSEGITSRLLHALQQLNIVIMHQQAIARIRETLIVVTMPSVGEPGVVTYTYPLQIMHQGV